MRVFFEIIQELSLLANIDTVSCLCFISAIKSLTIFMAKIASVKNLALLIV